VPVPYFLLFLCFRKAIKEIFSELYETKAEVPIFPDTRRSPNQRRRGARGQAHPRAARPAPCPRHQGVWPPGPLPDTAPPPIYSPRRENPKHPINFLETYREPSSSSTRDREGPESSSRHPAGVGNHHQRPSSLPCLPLE
jgi:hypothetical protein